MTTALCSDRLTEVEWQFPSLRGRLEHMETWLQQRLVETEPRSDGVEETMHHVDSERRETVEDILALESHFVGNDRHQRAWAVKFGSIQGVGKFAKRLHERCKSRVAHRADTSQPVGMRRRFGARFAPLAMRVAVAMFSEQRESGTCLQRLGLQLGRILPP